MGNRILLITALWLLLWPVAAGAQTPTGSPDSAPAPQAQPAQSGDQTGDETGEAAPADAGAAAMTDIHDIKSLVAVPVPLSPALIALWTGLGLLAAGAVLGGWYLWKKRKKPTVEAVEAMLSPEDAARMQLQALSPDTAEAKAFYFRLSAVFREYLQGRFDVDGLEMTTEELLPHLEALPLEREMKREMRRFLVSSDPVKFADAPARREEMARDLDFVREVVEKTAASRQDPEETADAPRDPSE